jgi:hypothetical protein
MRDNQNAVCRRALAARLRARWDEIEYAILLRIRTVAPLDEGIDPEYLHGFRGALQAAIAYGLLGVELGANETPPTPEPLLAQVRLAARTGVPVGVVLRRYTVGCNQLTDFVVAEAERDRQNRAAHFRIVLQELARLFERMLDDLDQEYARQARPTPGSLNLQLVERLQRRLAGEPVALGDINYNFDGHHVGAVAEGDKAIEALRSIAKAIDGRLLAVCPHNEVVWAWLGTRQRLECGRLFSKVVKSWPTGQPIALGEPGRGAAGWCLTHEQALEAFPFALRDDGRHARYAEIAVRAAVERDRLASTSLRQLSRALVADDREGDHSLSTTLKVYLDSGRNAASAGAALGLTRQTISNHLKRIEKRLDRSLTVNTADIEIALWLAEDDRIDTPAS